MAFRVAVFSSDNRPGMVVVSGALTSPKFDYITPAQARDIAAAFLLAAAAAEDKVSDIPK